jgi:hypothetical protein
MKRNIKFTKKTKRRIKPIRKTRKQRKHGGANGWWLLIAIAAVDALRAGRTWTHHKGDVMAVKSSGMGPPMKPPQGFKLIELPGPDKNPKNSKEGDDRLTSVLNFLDHSPESFIHGVITKGNKDETIALRPESGKDGKLTLVLDIPSTEEVLANLEERHKQRKVKNSK